MEIAIRRPFEPQLHRRYAAAHRTVAERDEVPPGNERIIGHEQEPERGS